MKISACRATKSLIFVMALLTPFIATSAIAQSPSPIAPEANGQGLAATARAVLLDEDPSDPKGRQYVGSVVWSTEVLKGAGLADDIAVHASVEIPERKFKMTMSLRRNLDKSLPATHTIDLTFVLPPDFVGGGVSNVPGILTKTQEYTRGTPLAALAVKVSDGVFLIGLSDVAADRARNMQALQERAWLDIPIVYLNQRRAIVAIEKGADGEEAFKAAFKAWGPYPKSIRTMSVPPSDGTGSYSVQVSSQRSEATAQASYEFLQGKYPDLLGSRTPLIKRVDLGDDRIYYRAMVGPFESSEDASRFCGSLKAAGGQCVVQRN